MVFAHQLLVHDLVEAALFEMRNIKVPFPRLGEDDQQEVIDRITKQAEDAAWTAVGIISSRSVDTIPITIADSKFKSKNITVTGVVDAQDPNRHGLVDLSGKLALLVLAPSDYAEGLDGIRAERDQGELPLSASEIIAGAGLDRQQEEEELPDGPDSLYPEALSFVQSTRRASISAIQRHLKIGYNRAARMLEQMETEGVVTAINSTGAREVIAQAEQEAGTSAASTEPLGKEFGDFDYDDAKQLVVLKSNGSPFKAHWLQSRLALSTEQVTALLIRLLDDKVLELEADGETSMDHIYKVVATLEQVV